MALDLSARLRENSCVVHEVGRRDAPATIVDRVIERARGGVVAVAPADPLVAELALVAAMRDRAVTLLLPDAPDWAVKDPEFHATPRQGAEFLRRRHVAAYLVEHTRAADD